MQQPRWLREAQLLGNNFNFRTVSPWRHNLVNLSLLITFVAFLIGTGALSQLQPYWLYVPLSGIIFGYLFFLIMILVVHEAAHYMFIVSQKSRRLRFWNRFFGWSVSIPFGINYSRHWERAHIIHHNHPMEHRDAQICHPRTGQALLKQIAALIFIPGYIFFRGMWRGKGTEYDCADRDHSPINWLGWFYFTIFWSVLVFVICPLLGVNGPIIFISCFIGSQIMSVLTVLKTAVEHGGPLGNNPNSLLRQRSTLSPIRFFICPLGLCYHFEHHLNLAVPWYNLRLYHQALYQLVPSEIASFIFNREIWKQLGGKKVAIPLTYDSQSASPT